MFCNIDSRPSGGLVGFVEETDMREQLGQYGTIGDTNAKSGGVELACKFGLSAESMYHPRDRRIK